MTEQKEILHIRIAERGKMYGLEGNYKEALRHYREAMNMTKGIENSEIFFQHYSQCAMEALEQSGAYDEVISFCEKYRDFLKEKETNELTQKHNAYVCERQAIQHLHKEEKEEALVLLTEAQNSAGRGKQPITDTLINWVQRGYQITTQQIRNTQNKYNYFIVRKDKVNPAIAMDLPQAASPF